MPKAIPADSPVLFKASVNVVQTAKKRRGELALRIQILEKDLESCRAEIDKLDEFIAMAKAIESGDVLAANDEPGTLSVQKGTLAWRVAMMFRKDNEPRYTSAIVSILLKAGWKGGENAHILLNGMLKRRKDLFEKTAAGWWLKRKDFEVAE